MKRTKETLEARVRETPLLDRLKECRQRIGKMCSEGRPPRMCIPVQHDDDDFFISTTLADAQATVEALREQLRLANIDQANAEARANDLQQQVEALQRERDTARRRVDELEAREGDVVLLRHELDAEREKVKAEQEQWEIQAREGGRLQDQLSQLQALVRAKEDAYEKILLSRERLEREMRGYPPVDNEGIPMVWQEPVGWVKRHPGRHDASEGTGEA